MKFNKNKIWAVLEQIVFAMFIIVALYAVGFATSGISRRGMTPTELNTPDKAGAITSVRENAIYGLSITGVVIAFVGVIMPLISLFYEKKLFNFIAGWTTISLDVVALVVITAAISTWASDLTYDKHIFYDKGYLAGQFILTFVGAGIAFGGIAVSYKDNLLKWA